MVDLVNITDNKHDRIGFDETTTAVCRLPNSMEAVTRTITSRASPNFMAFDPRKDSNTIKKSEMSRISAFPIGSL